MNDDCVILLMPVRIPHEQGPNSIYFVTFTCYNWLPLFEITNSYDLIYKWFDYLYSKNIRVAGYVIMPNHIHLLLYFPEMTSTLNTIIGNAKRMLAYEIIKRLVKNEDPITLSYLAAGVKERERKKGQLHKVFNESFDAKKCITPSFVFQKLDYIHHNPTSGKWSLAGDFISYKHSSASFYEHGVGGYERLMRIEEVM